MHRRTPSEKYVDCHNTTYVAVTVEPGSRSVMKQKDLESPFHSVTLTYTTLACRLPAVVPPCSGAAVIVALVEAI
jgi:hypothetical protein